MNNVSIKMDLSPKQREVLQGAKRFTLWRAGRRSGKTHAAEYWFIKRALTNPNSVNWYVAQDVALCQELNIPLFEKIVPSELIKEYSKSEKCFTLFNGSRCYFKTANSSDSLRGRGLDNLVCEEAAFWRNGHGRYNDTLRPQLADRLGHCLIITSPPTKDAPPGAEWIRRMETIFNDEIKNGSKDHVLFQSNIYDNPFIQDSEKESLKRTTDPDTWQVEYMGEYCDKIGQVYWEFDPLTRKLILDPNTSILARVRGADHGIDANTAVAWIFLTSRTTVHISDEYVGNNMDIPTHAISIKAKTPYPVLWTCLDSACWGRESDLSSPAKRFGAAGIPVTPGTKDLAGSQSDMKMMFAAGNISIDPKCINLLKAIDSFQHGQHEPDILAAVRYGIDALIRSGKLMHPVRVDKPKTIQERWNEMDELDKRTRELNAKFFNTNRKPIQSFRIINK